MVLLLILGVVLRGGRGDDRQRDAGFQIPTGAATAEQRVPVDHAGLSPARPGTDDSLPEPVAQQPVAGDTQPAPNPGSAADTVAVPGVVGMDLQLAQDTMQAAGLYLLTEVDASGQDRLPMWDRGWTVIGQSPAAGTVVPDDTGIALEVLRSDEAGTSSGGAAAPSAGVIPDVVCLDLQLAQDTMQASGYYSLGEQDGSGEGRRAILDRGWVVVEQSPAAGTPAPEDARVVLTYLREDEASTC